MVAKNFVIHKSHQDFLWPIFLLSNNNDQNFSNQDFFFLFILELVFHVQRFLHALLTRFLLSSKASQNETTKQEKKNKSILYSQINRRIRYHKGPLLKSIPETTEKTNKNPLMKIERGTRSGETRKQAQLHTKLSRNCV